MEMETPVPSGDHPIQRRDYILPTPPIVHSLAKVNEVVQCGDPGLALEGLSRSGKTYFTRYLDGEVVDYAGRPIPVFRVVASKAKVPTELRFYSEVYQDTFGSSKRLATASDYLGALRGLFICAARAAQCQDVLLVIDQAGRWPWEHLVWLSDLQNKILDVGVHLVVLLVGHKLTELRMNLVRNNHSDVVARYLHQIYEFRSLSSVSDVACVLHCYDQATSYPIGSGISYTQHFLPGVHLEPHAKMIWDIFRVHTRQRAGKTPKGWPTAYFTKTVEQLLVVGNRQHQRKVTEGLIRTALDLSAFSENYLDRKKGT